MSAQSATGIGTGSVDNYTTKEVHNSLTSVPKKYNITFDNSSLVANVLTIKHNFGNKYVSAYNVYNNHDQQIVPDQVQAIDVNTLTMTFTSLMPLTGTWHLIVIG